MSAKITIKKDALVVEELLKEEPHSRSLRAELRDWFGLIAKAEAVISWKDPYETLLVLLIISVVFVFIYLFSPPYLITIGCIGLSVSLMDYCGPLLAPRLSAKLPPEEALKNYHHFCSRLVRMRLSIVAFFGFMSDLRNSSQISHFFICSSFLCILGFIGLHVGGVLLCYALALACLTVPKLRLKWFVKLVLQLLWIPSGLVILGVKKTWTKLPGFAFKRPVKNK